MQSRLSGIVLGCCGLWAVVGCGGADENPVPPDTKATSLDDEETPTFSMTGLTVQQEPFGELTGPDGQKYPITRFLLSNGEMTVAILDYGAIVQSLSVPDKTGTMQNVTLGFDNLKGYTNTEEKDPYFGAIVGRYGNRIAKGKFTLDGTEYTLATNNGPNHLHGGNRGFNDVRWQARPMTDDLTEGEAVGVELTYVSPDGEEGYPGELKATVTYRLTKANELRIEYSALSTKPTPVNLTNHCYWNLGGVDYAKPKESTNILEHVLMLNCDRYLPVDETLIPTGEMQSVAGGPFDFTRPKPIGQDFAAVKGDQEQGGYDHCFVVAGWDEDQPQLKLIARVSDPQSGRVMEVHTDQPGIQFYTGNFLSGGPADGGFPQHHAFCLETQRLPDSPNQSEFPNSILRPGEVYQQVTVHKFSVEK